MSDHTMQFGDVVRSVSVRGHQVEAQNYVSSGKYPIIDQGAELIAGYSDDESKVLHSGPVVVFGDHTRNVKFVDFPFVVGADGTKILQPIDDQVSARFLAYLTEFAAGRIPNLGYSRHFKELKEVPIWLPMRSEQDRIVEIVHTWDQGLQACAALIVARRKALEIARLNLIELSGADVAELGTFAVNTNRLLTVEVAAQRDLFCIELEHMEEGTGRIVGTADILQLRGSRRAFSAGDVLFGRLRPYLRKFIYARKEGVCSTEVWVISANTTLCFPRYLYQIVQTERFTAEANKSSGSRMPRADWDVVSRVEFPLPSIERQQEIADRLTAEEEALDLLIQLSDRLRSQRAGLIDRLLSGKLRRQMLGGGSHQVAEAAHA
jgi:hypothetical protein